MCSQPADRAGRYRLGLKLFRLGGVVVARFDERQAALPHMEALHATTGETVFLCIRRGLEVYRQLGGSEAQTKGASRRYADDEHLFI